MTLDRANSRLCEGAAWGKVFPVTGPRCRIVFAASLLLIPQAIDTTRLRQAITARPSTRTSDPVTLASQSNVHRLVDYPQPGL